MKLSFFSNNLLFSIIASNPSFVVYMRANDVVNVVFFSSLIWTFYSVLSFFVILIRNN